MGWKVSWDFCIHRYSFREYSLLQVQRSSDQSLLGECLTMITSSNLYAEFMRVVATPSDINQHCEKLRQLSAQCNRVTEFGMRSGVSTTALLAGQPKTFVTYDLNYHPVVDKLLSLKGKTDFSFKRGDTRLIGIDETDFLFIDTLHTEEQLTTELSRHAEKVKRWIALHDTMTFGYNDEGGGPGRGLRHALKDFLADRQEWRVIYDVPENNGLTVIEKTQN